ncbi:B3 domain-containing protein [Parasponia andersonii]|uniref:B3 domain-containing protein n=1 Tax=Parasponia andersonii TaxID=3476 RepID=A0A2P5DR70_PARAD|nr:B3 domain-containing protein [Parasponia andersonii]
MEEEELGGSSSYYLCYGPDDLVEVSAEQVEGLKNKLKPFQGQRNIQEECGGALALALRKHAPKFFASRTKKRTLRVCTDDDYVVVPVNNINDAPSSSVVPNNATKKRVHTDDQEEDMKTTKKKKNLVMMKKKKRETRERKRVIIAGPDPPPPMPEALMEKIRGIEGVDLSSTELIIQKQLRQSDLQQNQNRISMPLRQITEEQFLTDEETTALTGRMENDEKHVEELEVKFVDPRLEHIRGISLRRWDYNSSTSYVLTKGWYNMIKSNQLRAKEIVQIWFFRANNIPGFALVSLLGPNGDHLAVGNRSSQHH